MYDVLSERKKLALNLFCKFLVHKIIYAIQKLLEKPIDVFFEMCSDKVGTFCGSYLENNLIALTFSNLTTTHF